MTSKFQDEACVGNIYLNAFLKSKIYVELFIYL